jgi:TrmH family RNA methyltransferase
VITSVRNQQVQRARKLAKRGLRDRHREFLVEGAIGVGEALAAGAKLEALFVTPGVSNRIDELAKESRRAGAPVFEVSEKVMQAISGAVTPPGLIGITQFRDVEAGLLLGRGVSFGVVLADVRDPGNLGAILRTAWAVGADAVFLGASTADVYNQKVVRASAGALFHLRFARDVEVPWLLDEMGRVGIRRIAADPSGPVAYDEADASPPCAFVFCNEAWGASEEVIRRVDAVASIPMRGSADSLNVALAAAVFLFEAQRRRKAAGATPPRSE